MGNRCAPMLAGLAFVAVSAAAQAQAPSQAQQDAIRSNCRSDFLSKCSGVPRGGREALECLMKNKASVSAGCQGALNAISAPAAAKPEPKPEPKPVAAPQPAPAPAATAPATPAAPTASAPAEPTTKRKPAPAPKAVATPARPASPAVPPPAAPAAVTPAAPPPPAETHQPKLGEAILIRRFCATDFRVLCKGVQLGQGRAVQCLANNAAALSPGCRDVMTKTGELRP